MSRLSSHLHPHIIDECSLERVSNVIYLSYQSFVVIRIKLTELKFFNFIYYLSKTVSRKYKVDRNLKLLLALATDAIRVDSNKVKDICIFHT